MNRPCVRRTALQHRLSFLDAPADFGGGRFSRLFPQLQNPRFSDFQLFNGQKSVFIRPDNSGLRTETPSDRLAGSNLKFLNAPQCDVGYAFFRDPTESLCAVFVEERQFHAEFFRRIGEVFPDKKSVHLSGFFVSEVVWPWQCVVGGRVGEYRVTFILFDFQPVECVDQPVDLLHCSLPRELTLGEMFFDNYTKKEKEEGL